MNFTVLWLFVKVFSTKFGGMVSFGVAKVSNLRKFSPLKLYFSPICKSFLSQFPAIRYYIIIIIGILCMVEGLVAAT